MRLLLDPHAFIWWDADPERLSKKAYDACMDGSNSLHLSYASILVMQIKIQTGKLKLRVSLAELIRTNQRENGLILETIDLPDILHLDTLPFHHRDPFDRMIIAQTMQRGYHVVTVDGAFADYEVSILW